MRLTSQEISALKQSLHGESYSAAYLFGSRTDDDRRGGDVDLLLYSARPAFALAHRVASRYAKIMDARLDVLVVDPQAPTREQQALIATLTLQPLDA
jgi:predicted nucleotidyltransferase